MQLSSDATLLIGVGVSAAQRLVLCPETLKQQQGSRLCTSRSVQPTA